MNVLLKIDIKAIFRYSCSAMKEEKKEVYINSEDDEIDLSELLRVIILHKKFIIAFTVFITILSIIAALLKPNIYRSKAVILPVQQTASNGLSASKFSNIASLAGVSLPSSANDVKIMAVLESDNLKINIIKKYNLLPILLYKSWDNKTGQWKKSKSIKSMLIGVFKNNNVDKKEKQRIRMANAVKYFSNIMNVNEDKKLGTIQVSMDYPDPQIASNLVNYVIYNLKNKLVNDTIQEARKKENILKKELIKTSDPTIQQGIYMLISKQIQTISTAKISENFAFQIIDPPIIPVFKYKPKRKLIVIVSFITGLFLSIFIVFFLEYLRTFKEKMKKNDS